MTVRRVLVYNGGGDSWRPFFRESVERYCERHGLPLIEDRTDGYKGYEHVKGFWLRKLELLAEQVEPFLYIDTDVWIAPWAPAPPGAGEDRVKAAPKKQPWAPSGPAEPVSSGVMIAPGGIVFAQAYHAMRREYNRPHARHLHGDQHFINRYCGAVERIDPAWNAIVPEKPLAPVPSDCYFYHPLAPARAEDRGAIKEERVKNTEAYRRAMRESQGATA